MKTNNLKGTLILGLAAFIWGMAFVAQSKVCDTIPTFTISACRSFIAAIFLFVFWKITTFKKKEKFFPKNRNIRKKYYLGAFFCGICLTIASNLQQFGISLYPKNAPAEAHAGFLTALYVILVPIFSVFIRKRVGILVWLGGIMASVGIYLLCFSGGIGNLYIGDLVVFTCSIAFAFHILSVDKYVGITGGIKLSIMQFFIVGVLSLIGTLIFELKSLEFSMILDGILPILYLGIMSSGVAYTLQIVGQKYAEPAVASITMSFESVFAVLGGVIFSSGSLKINEIIGCTVMFIAIIVAQIPEILQNKKS